MKLKKKRGLMALLLTLAMVLSLIPTAAFAETGTITEVRLSYDKAALHFNTYYKEGDVQKSFGASASTTTEGVSIDTGNSWLQKKAGSDWHGIGDGTGMISAETEYALEFLIDAESGYDWIDKKEDTSIKFYLNDTLVTPDRIRYSSPGNFYRVLFIIGKPDKRITVTNDGNGTASASHSVAAKGETVTLSSSPNEGYKFKEWKVLSGGITVTDNKFTMNDSDVEVKAVFEAIVVPPGEHSITVQNDVNGNLTSDKPSAKAGDKVKLTLTPNAGYSFKSWEKTPASLDISSDNTFTMPDSDVTVKAIFEKIPATPPIVIGGGGLMLPPPAETEEVKAAKEAATKAVTELLKAETFSGEEQKKAEEIKKDFDDKLAKVDAAEEAKKLETETLAAISALWSDGETSLKAKVEAIGRAEIIAKTRVVKTKKGAKAVRISWNKVDGLDFDGYEIYRSTNKTSFGKTPIKTADGTKSSYLNTKNLRKGKTYYYRVKAFKMVNGEKVYTGFSTKTWKTPKK